MNQIVIHLLVALVFMTGVLGLGLIVFPFLLGFKEERDWPLSPVYSFMHKVERLGARCSRRLRRNKSQE